ncbi:Cna B-type domain-containing protein [Schaalia hyovaginalis]|uniref:Cna B-type domain-containing protein n=1 Tax=Schaalia hyovaginalis TaxID=29316 RepID=A0A923E470_9ACTO|nr:hypothetical protein [Schaalia hyovaginalis]
MDAADEKIVLKDAVFTVTKPDGSTFELTTGEDGTVVSGVLEQGMYKVKEKKAPAGYELNDQEFTLNVTPAGGAIQTVTDKKMSVEVSVEKKWKDGDDQDGKRPASITVHLLADGVDTGKTLVLNADMGWKGSFTGLPKYKSGKLIEYTISEAQVAGVDPSKYTVKITGNMSTICGFTITNANIETVDVDGVKTWSDDEDRDGKRPESTVVRLKADGVEKDSKTVTPDAGGRWSYAFTGLPKYTTEGRLIEYTVTEDAVPEYATRIEGKQIINSYTPGKTSVSVTKAWDDAEDQDGKRPESVKVQLFADGKALGSPVELSGSTGWTHTWTDLFLKDKGKEIAYTIVEDRIEGYTSRVDKDGAAGFVVTNTQNPKGGLAKTGADAVGVGAMTLLLGGAGALAWGAGRRKKA